MAIKVFGTQFPKANLDTSKYPNFEITKELVDSKDINLADFRQAYSDAMEGKPFPLSNDHIIAMISSADDDYEPEVFAQAMQLMVEGKNPDVAMAEAIANNTKEEETTETEKKTEEIPLTPEQAKTASALGKAIHLSAIHAAERAAKDKELNADLHAIMVAPSTVKRGSVVLLHRLHKLYSVIDDDANVLETEIDGWPEIGSKYEAGKGSNQRFDIYEYTPDNGGDKIKGSWSKDFYDTLPEAKSFRDEVELINAAIDKEKPTPTKYKDSQWTDSRLKNLKKTVQARYNTGFQKFKDAIRLRHKMVEVNEKCDKLVASFDYVRDNKTDKPVVSDDGALVLRDTDEIICVAPKGRAGDLNYYTVKEFLRCKPDVAAKAGGTMGALKETVAKAPSPKGKGKKDVVAQFPEIKDFNQLELCLTTLGNFFEGFKTVKQRAEMRTTFNKRLTGESRNDTIELLGGCYEGLMSLFTPNLQEEYGAIMEKKTKAEEAARKEKAA